MHRRRAPCACQACRRLASNLRPTIGPPSCPAAGVGRAWRSPARSPAARSSSPLDEPLGARDPLTRIEMQALVGEVWREQGFTAVLVTHDVTEAIVLGDRVELIEDGIIKLELNVDLPRPRRRGLAGGGGARGKDPAPSAERRQPSREEGMGVKASLSRHRVPEAAVDLPASLAASVYAAMMPLLAR